MRTTILLLLGLIALGFTQMGGCYYHHDDGDDIRITIINDFGDEVWIEGDHPSWGWNYLMFVDEGETRVLYLSDAYDGEDLKAVDDDDDTVSRTEVRDGITWTILGGR